MLSLAGDDSRLKMSLMLPNENEIASRDLTPVARLLRLDAAAVPTSHLFSLLVEDVKEEPLARGVGHTNALDVAAPAIAIPSVKVWEQTMLLIRKCGVRGGGEGRSEELRASESCAHYSYEGHP